ncbi:MAG: hypothetical protein RLZZ618_2128 [Pseudomonadota bacterium]
MTQLLDRPTEGRPSPWLNASAPAFTQRGVSAYQAHAGASAERALRSAFPTVDAVLGGEAFDTLARRFWREHPPVRGDLGQWGEGLASFIDTQGRLDEAPYLADVARLDWTLAQAERAPDRPFDPASLQRLGEAEASALFIQLVPGAAVLHSTWPLASIWLAHQATDEADPFAPVRKALAERREDWALVWREGWRARAVQVDAPTARWTLALLQDASLAEAFEAAGDGFEFEPWLVLALQSGWLSGVRIEPSTG